MIVIHKLDTLDIFYDIGYLSTATNLEPLLGICVACVPVCRPLLISFQRKLSNASSSALNRIGINSSLPNDSKHQNSSTGNEGVIGKYVRPANRKDFRRLDDSGYLMTDLEGTTRCEGIGNVDSFERVTGSPSNQGIRVIETWDVETEGRP